MNFVKWHAYKEKSKENACKPNQISGGKLSRLARWSLITTCNRSVKSISAGRVEILSRQAGAMWSAPKNWNMSF